MSLLRKIQGFAIVSILLDIRAPRIFQMCTTDTVGKRITSAFQQCAAIYVSNCEEVGHEDLRLSAEQGEAVLAVLDALQLDEEAYLKQS